MKANKWIKLEDRPYFSKKTLKRFQEIIKTKNFSNFIGSPGEKNLNKN